MWRCLETISGLVAVPAVWRSWLGDDFAGFHRAFLRKMPGRAESYPCPHECGCSHGLVPSMDGRFVAVCACEPSNCDDFAVTAAEVILLELDCVRLGRAVASALGVVGQVEAAGDKRVWQIGMAPGTTTPVLLCVEQDRDDFRAAVAELAGRLKGPFLLIAPTGAFLSVATQQLLAGSGAKFLDLETHFSINPNGTLAPSTHARELVACFVPEQREELKNTEARRIFELFRKLGTGDGIRTAHLDEVFRLMVLDGLNQRTAAKKCKCSEATISARVATIEEKFGMSVEQLQAYASKVLDYESAVKGDRRANKKHGVPMTEVDAGDPVEDEYREQEDEDG